MANAFLAPYKAQVEAMEMEAAQKALKHSGSFKSSAASTLGPAGMVRVEVVKRLLEIKPHEVSRPKCERSEQSMTWRG